MGTGSRSPARSLPSPFVTAAAVVVCSLTSLAAAGQVSAKEGAVARLENPAVLRAAPGTAISLVWSIRDSKQRDGGGGGVYVRLRGCTGTISGADAVTLGRGRYSARVVIPRGGVRAVGIGMRGWIHDLDGTRRRDVAYPVVNRPRLGC